MNEPKVSVVIPSYNKSSYISDTVQSVINQDYPDIEIIVVDNGSTDGTIQVLAELESKFQNLKFIKNESNLGPSGARNVGILASTGEYVFFLDGDDVFFPTKIRTQVRLMETDMSLGLSLTSYLITNDHVSNIRLVSFSNFSKLIHGWFSMRGFGGLVESTGCIRKKFLTDSLLFDETLMGSEGLDFTKKWASEHRSELIKVPLTLYRMSENQLHLNTSAIAENMTRITFKYFNGDSRKRLLHSQQAFFALDAIRSETLHKVLVYLLKIANPEVIFMAKSIVFRNIRALLGGAKYRKTLESLFESLR